MTLLENNVSPQICFLELIFAEGEINRLEGKPFQVSIDSQIFHFFPKIIRNSPRVLLEEMFPMFRGLITLNLKYRLPEQDLRHCAQCPPRHNPPSSFRESEHLTTGT